MEIWEFMKAYADSFWNHCEFAFDIFSVLMAWFVTIGCGLFFILVLPGIGYLLTYTIKHWNEI